MVYKQDLRDTAEIDKNEVGGDCKKSCRTGIAPLLGPLRSFVVPENATLDGKFDVYR